eukprot:4989002-Prymnesium_polylepis.1
MGLVDGRSHRAPGRKVTDRARRASKADVSNSREGMADFDSCFDLAHDTVEKIAALDADAESYTRFQEMVRLQPGQTIAQEYQ